MPELHELAAELQRRGRWDESLDGLYGQLVQRGIAQPLSMAQHPSVASEQVPGVERILDPNEQPGVDPGALDRLRNTGITPGTAMEFAGLHIARETRLRGAPLDEREQLAIQDIYKRAAGRGDVGNVNQFQATHGKVLANRRETIGGRLQDAGGSYVNTLLAQPALNALGLVDPDTAEKLNENVQYAYGADPDSRAAYAGKVGGEIVKTLTVGRLAGAGGMGAFYGLQGVGDTRRDVERRRDAGQQISNAQEWTTAGAIGAVEGLSGFVGGKIFERMAGVIRSMPGLTQAAGREGVKVALRLMGLGFAEGAEEAVTTAIENKIYQMGIDPQRALLEGTTEAFQLGLVVSVFGGEASAQRQGTAAGMEATANPASPGQPSQAPIAGAAARTDAPGAADSSPAAAVPPTASEPTPDASPEQSQQVVIEPLPDLPVEKTKAEILSFASHNGYDVRGLENKGKRIVLDTLAQQQLQRAAKVAGSEMRQQNRAAMATQKQLPQGSEGWDSGKLRQFAREHGYSLDERRVEVMSRETPDAPPRMSERDAVRQQIEEQYALPKGKGPTADAPRPLAADQRAALIAEIESHGVKSVNGRALNQIDDRRLRAALDKVRVDPKRQAHRATLEPERQRTAAQSKGLPKMPGMIRKGGTVAEIQAWASANGYKVRKLLGRAKLIESINRQQRDSQIDLPRIDYSPQSETAKAFRFRAQQAGYDMEGVPQDKGAIRKAIKARRRAAFAARDAAAKGEGAAAQPPAQAVPQQAQQQPASQPQQASADPAAIAEQNKPSFHRARESAREKLPALQRVMNLNMPQWLEDWITPVSSRIRDISPRIYGRLMRMEFNTGYWREFFKRELHDPAARVIESLGGRDSAKFREWSLLVMNGNRADADAMLPSDDARKDAHEFYRAFRTLLDFMRNAGVNVGDLGEDYWPRFLRDYDGLKSLDGELTGRIEQAWDLAKKAKGRGLLTVEEKTEIANQVIQGFGPVKPGSFGISSARERRIDALTDAQLDFYLNPIEAAFRYVDGAIYAAERARFLGKNHELSEMGETVGKIVQEEVDAGRLDRRQQDLLVDLLKTRFTADMMTMAKPLRTFKQLSYLLMLGNVGSTITQLTDVMMTTAMHGAGHTGRSVLRLSDDDKRIMMEEIGVHSYGEEFKDIGAVARATDKALTLTGFKWGDRFGKENHLNAAYAALREAARDRDSEAFKRLERDYRPALGDEAFERTMRDLANGARDNDVNYLLFLDLTRIQPLTSSQMPKRYLEMPNGRILYTMKTFWLTRLDFIRREAFRKIVSAGERKEGLQMLARVLLLCGLLGEGLKELVLDLIRGKPLSPEQVDDRAVGALLNVAGLNRYVANQAWESPTDAVWNYVAPPTGWVESLWKDTPPGADEGIRSFRYVPLIGELLYFWTPLGRGWKLSEDQARTEYRAKLKELWREAYFARLGGDYETAAALLKIYNERRQEGSGDGRKRPLAFADLRTLPLTGDERVDRRQMKADARRSLDEGRLDEARDRLRDYNEGRRSRLTLARLRSQPAEG